MTSETASRPGARRHLLRLLATTLTALAAAGCQSTTTTPANEPYWGALTEERPEQSIGFVLSEIDARLRAWTNYKLTGTSRRDERTLRMIEQELRLQSHNHFEELREQLESGPPKNRSVAAMALGFSGRDDEALSPLLSTLDEEDNQLVGNALIALGLLENEDTPVAQICHLLNYHLDPFTRSNAAFCLQRLTSAGVRDDCIRDSCRDALLDQEPGVRAQAATILGVLEDSESNSDIALLLNDEENLVVSAAAHSLVMLGRADPHVKGDSARALVNALDDVPKRMRTRLFFELSLLAELNYGDDEDAWKDWAFRLD